MELQYANRSLKKTVKNFGSISASYGTRAKLVSQRLSDLEAAPTLEVMKSLPGNCHELHGNLKGKLAIDISGNHRIIFEVIGDPIPKKEDGGLDWSKVKEISIVAIGEDYH